MSSNIEKPINNQRGTQAQDVRMKSCGLAESSCSSFRPQDFSQDDYFFRAFVFLQLIAGWCLKSQDDFPGRGRPQGNRDKTDLRLFPKNHDFSRSGPPAGQRGQNCPSFILENHVFLRPGPPAGQRGQNWPSFIKKENHDFVCSVKNIPKNIESD